MADGLREAPGVTILNDVVLNQVLVRFAPPPPDGPVPDEAAIDAFTRDVIAAVQADGTCWLGGTTWHGMAAMRISVSNWSTRRADAHPPPAAGAPRARTRTAPPWRPRYAALRPSRARPAARAWGSEAATHRAYSPACPSEPRSTPSPRR